MKKLILVLLVLVPALAFSQSRVQPFRPYTEVIQLNDSVASGATYAASQKDTTIAYQLQNFTDAYFVLTSTDSISVVVKYSASADGATFEDGLVTIDSISTTGQAGAAANGIQRSLQVPKAVMGLAAVKFHLEFNANLNGVTTPKYTARLVRR
jgi:hypothetical protein